jgi:transposase-like protein
MTNAEYVDKAEVICPFCGSTEVEWRSLEVEGNAAYQRGDCLSCNKSWFDTYYLVGYLEIEEE